MTAGELRVDGCRIDVEAGFVLHRAGEEQITCDNSTLRDNAFSLVSLIDQSIKSLIREQNGALSLTFANGATLTLRVDPQGFDSFHLHTATESVDI
jgi:hypothetical protein